MDSAELNSIIRTKKLYVREVAEMAHVNIRTVFRWLKGVTPIPGGAAELVALKTSFLPDVEISAEQVPSE